MELIRVKKYTKMSIMKSKLVKPSFFSSFSKLASLFVPEKIPVALILYKVGVVYDPGFDFNYKKE